VGSPITWLDLLPEISQLPPLPDFCHPVEWAVQLPDLIPLTRLSGQSTYLTQFATWNLPIATITWFLSPSWVGSTIIWLDSSHPVEWAIHLSNPIFHLKYPNSQNYPIFVTRLNGQSNYPTRFATWNLPIATITHFLLPSSNYLTQFVHWNLQIAKITRFLSPSWVGLPTEISKFPTLLNICCPVWAGHPITQPNLPPEISKLPNHLIFVTQFV